jgi:hypothetical protein
MSRCCLICLLYLQCILIHLQRLLAWNPFKVVRPDPQPLLELLVNWQQPLAGNTCPANASTPLQGCPAGYYCKHEAAMVACPPGFFCPVSVLHNKYITCYF